MAKQAKPAVVVSSPEKNQVHLISDESVDAFQSQFERLVGSVESVIVGKPKPVRLALIALLSEGHLLIEDVPGTGKTSLAKSITQSMDGAWSRIQFTPDLLPSDVTGTTIFNQSNGSFEFHPGPVFANIVVADEINRASPKTQSSLLEVMEEHQVTVDSVPHGVPRPFMVVATQNPIEFEGTYRLPEAQLDRFMMKLSIGYLAIHQEIDVLEKHGKGSKPPVNEAVLSADEVRQMVVTAESVHVEPEVTGYIVGLAQATREMKDVRLGVSTRGCLSLLKASRVAAAAAGRSYVIPDDVKVLAPAIFSHRLLLTPEAEMRRISQQELVDQALIDVKPPFRKRG